MTEMVAHARFLVVREHENGLGDDLNTHLQLATGRFTSRRRQPKVKTYPRPHEGIHPERTSVPTETCRAGTQPERGTHADSVCCACPGRAMPRTWRDPDA